MAAILGLEDSVIEEACAKVTSGVVRPVNYNCPGQLVIAGEKRLSQRRSKTQGMPAHAVRSRLRYPVHSTPADGKGCRRAARLRCGLYLLRTEDGYLLQPRRQGLRLLRPAGTSRAAHDLSGSLDAAGEERHGCRSDLGVRDRSGQNAVRLAGKISKELTCKTVQDMAGVQAAAE